MALRHETRRSNDVRAPAVSRGTAVIVTRYREDVAKVALLNPRDLAMLERSHELVEAAAQIEPQALSNTAIRALQLEDRPNPTDRVESAEQIAAILDL